MGLLWFNMGLLWFDMVSVWDDNGIIQGYEWIELPSGFIKHGWLEYLLAMEVSS